MPSNIIDFLIIAGRFIVGILAVAGIFAGIIFKYHLNRITTLETSVKAFQTNCVLKDELAPMICSYIHEAFNGDRFVRIENLAAKLDGRFADMKEQVLKIDDKLTEIFKILVNKPSG